MEYPESVLTKKKKEVRSLVDKGEFVRYEYLDPKTGEKIGKKIKLILKGKEREEYFMIPIENKRFLLLPAMAKPKIIWNGKKAIEV